MSTTRLSLLPNHYPKDEAAEARAWVGAQMAVTPTLLPTLKFHDLVFGHDLGKFK